MSYYRWLSVRTKVSSGFRDVAVSEEDVSRTHEHPGRLEVPRIAIEALILG